MSYIKQQWKTGDVISAEKLNHIESGLEAVDKEQGPAGITPQLQNDGTAIQVSYDEGQSYTNLVQLSEITGPQGPTGEGFAIYKTYASITDMEADAANVEEGKFVMITSTEDDPDNAKLYVKAESGFNYVTDLSGAQGIQGPQGEPGVQGPQGEPGKDGVTPVITVEATQLAYDQPISVAKSGTDAEPHFTFGIPAGQPGKDAELPDNLVTYSDFTYGDQQRKTIQLANYDSISGIGTDDQGYNIAMVSKWDKVDLGTPSLTMNLNSKDGQVQINDEKIVATVDQIPDVSGFATKEELQTGLDSKQATGDYALKSELITPEEVVASEPMQNALETVRSEIPTMTEIATSPEVSGLIQGLATEASVENALEGKQDKGDYALNSALEPLATKEAVASLKVVDLGTFEKVENASYAASADSVYNNKEAVILTFDTAEGSGVIFNTMTAANSSAQRMYWNNQVLSRTVTNGSGTGWGVLSNFTELQNRAIKSTLFTLTTEADSETIKAAMTNENSKTITASDLDSCLKYGYTIRDYALQSGSIFVGWTGSAYTLTYIGFASPTSEPYVMSVVVNVTPEGEYSIVRNGVRGQILTSSNLASNKTFAAVADVAPVIVNINLRDSKLTTEVQEKETILNWFGVTTDAELKQLIASTRPMFVRYGISLSTNPHYYKMPIEYIAYESATQLKMVFSGLDTSNDQPVRYTIIANLDGTPIEEGGNVSMVLEPIDTQAEIANLATKQELSEGLAGKQDKGDYAMNEVVQAEFESYDKTIKAYVDSKLTAVYTYKGSVANTQALPTENQTIGDVYNVEDTGKNVAWDGEKWDELGATVDLSAYAKTEDVNAQLASKANVEHTHEIADVDSLQDALDSKAVTVSHVGLNQDTIEIKQGEQVIGQFEAPAHPVKVNASLFIDDGSFYDPDAGLGGHPDYFNNVAWSGGDSLSEEQLAQGPFLLITGTNTIASESEITVLTNLVPLGKDSALGKFYANKEELAELANQLPVEIKLPIRTGIGGFQDKLYTQEEIFAWFGVTDLSGFLALAKSTRQVWISYVVGASFQTSAYRYLANYIEYVPSSQSITVIWVGPDSANADVISKFVFKANLDQTVISGASNVQLTVTSIE